MHLNPRQKALILNQFDTEVRVGTSTGSNVTIANWRTKYLPHSRFPEVLKGTEAPIHALLKHYPFRHVPYLPEYYTTSRSTWLHPPGKFGLNR